MKFFDFAILLFPFFYIFSSFEKDKERGRHTHARERDSCLKDEKKVFDNKKVYREMAQAAIVLREKRRRERRNTLQPTASLDDDAADEHAAALQQHLQQIANLSQNLEPQNVNEKKINNSNHRVR